MLMIEYYFHNNLICSKLIVRMLGFVFANTVNRTSYRDTATDIYHLSQPSISGKTRIIKIFSYSK